MTKTWQELKEAYYKSTTNGVTLYLIEGKNGFDLYHICGHSSDGYKLRKAKDHWLFSENYYDSVRVWRWNRANCI